MDSGRQFLLQMLSTRLTGTAVGFSSAWFLDWPQPFPFGKPTKDNVYSRRKSTRQDHSWDLEDAWAAHSRKSARANRHYYTRWQCPSRHGDTNVQAGQLARVVENCARTCARATVPTRRSHHGQKNSSLPSLPQNRPPPSLRAPQPKNGQVQGLTAFHRCLQDAIQEVHEK